jgi:hypothetical protein
MVAGVAERAIVSRDRTGRPTGSSQFSGAIAGGQDRQWRWACSRSARKGTSELSPITGTGSATATWHWAAQGTRRREFGARAVVVVAIDDQAAAFNRHLDFDELDDRRLWRRLVDGERALGE